MSTRNSNTTRQIGELLRRYGVLGLRVGETFAQAQRMEHVDLRALTLISQAEHGGTPGTTRSLRDQLGLSAGGTTLVLDRLERGGHIRRVKDPQDRRVVRLLMTEEGRRTGSRYFGGLAARLAGLADGFSEQELEIVHRFVQGLVELTEAHLAEHAAGRERAP
ncbi:DNA-binding MarR family transcriptional regulator [Crossiella equi]|uniref:DNA-binding MarR family transcriptional regulator n=1 Tax=Crossiella equi TaxID=130796 RepID=A0ABS5A6U1_9PSEU|nr:MarR family transcriptional regulator [Crossiella equi]MBP2472271.1 DNA-binding MarR family transcriptional regulator [Crossiella equi]